MASSSRSVFSETLQEITNTKLEELSKRRSDFEATKSSVLSELAKENEPAQRLSILSRGVKTCFGLNLNKHGKARNAFNPSRNSELELELKNLDCFLAQAKYDPSLSAKTMRASEESLLRHLDVQSLKYQYASLYAQLVTEWLSTEKSMGSDLDDIAMMDGFEDVASEVKRDAREQWEHTVFDPAKVDEEALRAYLNKLFNAESAETSPELKALKQLRDDIADFEGDMLAPNQFNSTTLRWAADGLLSSGLLSDEKRDVLKEIKNNPIILGEVADVLNMRIQYLDSWSWGSKPVLLEQRRQISGIYNVLMHEDLLQAIFLQYIGVKWSVFLKKAFVKFRTVDGAWKSSRKRISQTDTMRRSYYLGSESRGNSVQSIRDHIYSKHYFMANLMDSESQRSDIAEGEEEVDYHSNHVPPQMPIPAAPMAQQAPAARGGFGLGSGQAHSGPLFGQPSGQAQSSLFGQGHMAQMRAAALPPPPPPPAARRARRDPGYGQWGRYEEKEDDDDDDPSNKNPMESKQRLLRLLSTEVAINTKLYGEVTAFHSMFERWNTLLPHETILSVLSFLGVSKTWLNFFRMFLKTPLKFLEDDPSTPSRNRSRGTPASHVLSDVFGESVIFCLDFSVNQSTNGSMLFRIQDDFWFWSRDHSAAVTAWKSVTEFISVTGTRINPAKSGTMRISQDPGVSLEIERSLPVGSIRWGFLKLSPKTGKFEIDQAMVDKHIIDLRKQLHDKRKSIISFIQAWNTYAATFFTYNFGKAANCFGRDHVAQMLATHNRIQREVFSPSSSLGSASEGQKGAANIVDYLKSLMQERFGVSNIPDAYLFFPMELGGLDLKSPFISILQVHDTVVENPSKTMDTFFEAEKEAYHHRKKEYEDGNVSRPMWQVEAGREWKPEKKDLEEFMSFSEYARYREDIRYGFEKNLHWVYKTLLKIPQEEGLEGASVSILSGLDALKQQEGGTGRGIKGDWNSMEPYWQWVAQLYGPEVMDRFGGLNIVEPGLLPMGMVSIFRDKRVKWQG